VDYLSRIMKKRAFVFILSDFLDTDYETALKTAARRHELIGVQMYDPGIFDLPEAGLLPLTDLETGETMLVDAFDKRTRTMYTQMRKTAHAAARQIFSRAKSDLLEMKTSDSVPDVLTRYFRTREKRFR
jgi:hypothetical protein